LAAAKLTNMPEGHVGGDNQDENAFSFLIDAP